MEGNARLPLTHNDRILARDAKLLFREEALADQRGVSRVKCKCRLCIGSVRSTRKREHARKHLRDIGRHPYHRGKTPVSKSISVLHLVHCLVMNPLLDKLSQYVRPSLSLPIGRLSKGLLFAALVVLLNLSVSTLGESFGTKIYGSKNHHSHSLQLCQ